LKDKIKKEVKNLFVDSNKTFLLSLVFVTVALFIFCYFGSASFFEITFASANNVGFWKIIYHNVMAFIIFFVMGTIFTKFVLKQNLTEFGLGFKHKKLSLWLVLISIPVAFLCGIMAITSAEMIAQYPLINLNVYNSFVHILLYYGSYFLYYLGWEYLFRGMFLNASKQKVGTAEAILITTLISALIHTSIAGFGKPMIETLSAIPAGLIFGYIAHKTKSIYPTLFIHFFIGVANDLCIYLFA